MGGGGAPPHGVMKEVGADGLRSILGEETDRNHPPPRGSDQKEERRHESRTLMAAGFYSETLLPIEALIVEDHGSVCSGADAGGRHGDGGAEHGSSDER